MAANEQHIRLSEALQKRKAHEKNVAYLKTRLEIEKKQAEYYDKQIKSVGDS